jgi:hypothetical protein
VVLELLVQQIVGVEVAVAIIILVVPAAPAS